MSADARPPPSALKGRLSDVFVPALVDGALQALARRLGNRATVDDPVHGRASSLASLEALLDKVAKAFQEHGALYRHVYSTTGVDRDAAEGVLSMTRGGERHELPIAVVTERRRLREIELRLYYASEGPRTPRGPIMGTDSTAAVPAQIAPLLEALRRGDVEAAVGAFEERGRLVDPLGHGHGKHDGLLASYLSSLGAATVLVAGSADDGRTCCVEGMLAHGGRDAAPALLSFERGDSGLVRELRAYWD